MKVKDQYDVVIIGGGIVGAGVFREQSLNNLSTLLLEQSDFSSQTSQGSSKMLHGGIRYLENMDFSLVYEALHEKNLWLKLCPHLTKEVPFYLPIYKESKWPLFFLRIGLFLYDLLSMFKNAPHQILSKKKTTAELPFIKSKGLTGCGIYYDGIVDDSKLALECIYDGLNDKCHALNYHKAIKIEKEDGKYIVSYQNTFSKEISKVKTKIVTFATGPFTDLVMQELNIEWSPIVLPSKGVHLWLKTCALPIKHAMVLQTKDNRIIFVIPQKRGILVGTTETKLTPTEKILDIKPSEEEIQYLIDVTNEYFPKANIGSEHILSSFAAVRPLIKSHKSSSKTSRKHKIYQPQENMYVLAGGKYTTFRKMAQHLNKIIFKKLQVKFDPSLTLQTIKRKSLIADSYAQDLSTETIEKIIKNEYVFTKEDLIKRRLSLPSLKAYHDEEVRNYIEKYPFKKMNLDN
jgi:glycerol-3-phosphate dehydrogenase